MGRSGQSRAGSFRQEKLGKNSIAKFGNVCFALFVVGVIVFTILAAMDQLRDPLFHPSTKIMSFLTSNTNSKFGTYEYDTLVKTDEDFTLANQSDVDATAVPDDGSDCDGDVNKAIDCRDPDVFHTMMSFAIENFKDIHFYRFGKPVRGSNDSTCDMAWRYRPKDGKAAAFYKDYRRFVISRSDECSYSVVSIGEYHTGVNARKKKKNQTSGLEKTPEGQTSLPVVDETVNDQLPIADSQKSFSHGKYLIYYGGGDRCKSMNHYLWSFMCALGEAQYLNRTFVMDLSLCLSSIYTSSNQDEEGKDFRFYFDFEHLRESASVIDQEQFWKDWNQWQKKNGLDLHLVEDFRVTPMKLADVKDTVVMRRFGSVEPDNYWYRVCEGDTKSVVQRPWNLIRKSSRLINIVSAILTRLNLDFDSVHVVRGEKAKNRNVWPNLDRDTSLDALLSSLRDKIDKGRNVYVSTDEADISFFDTLKDKYLTHFLNDYRDLWDENSEWYSETTKLNSGVPVEFDGYMRVCVDTEVFLRGKKQVETFNDLTKDCKDGINTCSISSS